MEKDVVRAAQLTAQNRQRQLQAWPGRAGRGCWGCTVGEGSELGGVGEGNCLGMRLLQDPQDSPPQVE